MFHSLVVHELQSLSSDCIITVLLLAEPLAMTMRGKAVIKLRFHYDTTTIRRYHDAFDYDGSDRNYDLRSIRLRYGYDTTTTKN